MHSHGRRFFTITLSLLALGGCKKQSPTPQTETGATTANATSQEFRVSGIEVGKKIGPDKRVTSPTTSFAPRDTIYVSVSTEGTASSKTIGAKWSFQDGQVVKQANQTIAPNGPASTEFHVAKASGWPVGKYKVEITVDGSPAGSKDFEVKQ